MSKPLRATAGQIAINAALPEELRDYGRVLDKKGMTTLLQRLGEVGPDAYRESSHALSQLGQVASYRSGGYSVGIEGLRQSPVAKKALEKLRGELGGLLADRKLTGRALAEAMVERIRPLQNTLPQAIYDEGIASKNPLAMQVASGARGNPNSLMSLLGSDLLFEDQHGKVIPLPILHSYSQGLTPAEHMAGSFGARKGVIATKMSVADAGYGCLTGNTLVRMADLSTRPIADVKVGEFVLGADKAGCTFPVRVTAVFDNGVRDVYRHVFAAGRRHGLTLELEATKDHKILAVRGHGAHRQAAAVMPLQKATRSFFAVMAGPAAPTPAVSEPLAFVLGCLLGDGCLSGNQATLSGANVSLIEQCSDQVAAYGCWFRPIKNHKYEYSLSRRDGLRWGAPGSPLRTKLRELGMLGKRSFEKALPIGFETWDNQSFGQLLAGLIETDGHVGIRPDGAPYLRLGMTARVLLEQLAEQVRVRCGLSALPLQTTSAESRNKTQRKVSPRMSNKHPIVARHAMHCLIISGRSEIEKLLRLIPLANKRCRLLAGDAAVLAGPIYSRFIEALPLGLRPTFDLEVDHPDHLFVLANGLVVSNSKKLNQLAHRLLVTANDEDDVDDDEESSPRQVSLPGAVRGLPATTDDPDNVGALLAAPFGGYPRNTVITPKVMADLKRQKVDDILVRSPMVGGPADGGVYARDLGIREYGRLPRVGEQVGLTAAQAIAEKLTQGQLSLKHSGGVAGVGPSGFGYITQLLEIPKHFPGGATHAQDDGRVESIKPAPAGGFNVTVAGRVHYVPHERQLKVKVGDEVEAGDLLTDGIGNPEELVRHKGGGEGRRYWARTFSEALKNSSIPTARRNVELMARGLINHVELEEEQGDYAPGDIVPYSAIEAGYTPRPDAVSQGPAAAQGRYLEQPVLHYTIGTKIRPSVRRELEKYKVENVLTHAAPPPFKPVMVRATDVLQHDPDWLTKMYGSSLTRGFMKSVGRTAVSDEEGTSFVPAMARSIEFGTYGKQKPPALPNPGQPLLPPAMGTQVGTPGQGGVAELPAPRFKAASRPATLWAKEAGGVDSAGQPVGSSGSAVASRTPAANPFSSGSSSGGQDALRELPAIVRGGGADMEPMHIDRAAEARSSASPMDMPPADLSKGPLAAGPSKGDPGWWSKALTAPVDQQTWGQSAAGGALTLGAGALANRALYGQAASTAAGIAKGVATGTAMSIGMQARPAASNLLAAVRGEEYDPGQNQFYEDKARELENGNMVGGALQGLTNPGEVIPAAAYSAANVMDIRRDADEQMWRAGRQDRQVADLQVAQNARQPATAYERDTQGLDYAGRAAYDAAHSPLAIPGLQPFRVPGTNWRVPKFIHTPFGS